MARQQYTNTTRERLGADQVAALPAMLTASEAAAVLGVSDITLRRMVREGRVRGTRYGRAYRIPKDALLAGLAGEPSGGGAA